MNIPQINKEKTRKMSSCYRKSIRLRDKITQAYTHTQQKAHEQQRLEGERLVMSLLCLVLLLFFFFGSYKQDEITCIPLRTIVVALS